MKITGNAHTINIETELPEEIPFLKRVFSRNQAPYLGSFATPERTGQGITISTKQLFELIENSQKQTTT